MEVIKNLDVLAQSCTQFLSPKRCAYNMHELVSYLRQYPLLKLNIVNTTVCLPAQEPNQIKLMLIRNRVQANSTCIVYLHGLSSYCFQGKFLIPFLNSNYSLCLFDSRGHGKNQSKSVTYGMLEAKELHQILLKLKEEGFQNIILWGRSMGAVTCLKLLKDYENSHIIPNITYLISDSPFNSFKKIATEMISQQIGIPQFVSGIIAQALIQKIKQKINLDFHQINFESLPITGPPILFIYSSRDEIIDSHHTISIYNSYFGPKDKIDIKSEHNQNRSNQVIADIFSRIERTVNAKQTLKESNALKNNEKKNGLTLSKSLKNSVLICKNTNLSKNTSLHESKGPIKIIQSRIYPIEVQNRRMRITENTVREDNFSFRAVRKTVITDKNELVDNKLQHTMAFQNRKISITIQKPSKIL